MRVNSAPFSVSSPLPSAPSCMYACRSPCNHHRPSISASMAGILPFLKQHMWFPACILRSLHDANRTEGSTDDTADAWWCGWLSHCIYIYKYCCFVSSTLRLTVDIYTILYMHGERKTYGRRTVSWGLICTCICMHLYMRTIHTFYNLVRFIDLYVSVAA